MIGKYKYLILLIIGFLFGRLCNVIGLDGKSCIVGMIAMAIITIFMLYVE